MSLLRSQDGEEFSYASGKEILEGTYSTVVMNKKTRLEGTLVIPNDIEAQSVVSLIESLNKPSRKSLKAKNDNKSKKEGKQTEEVKPKDDVKPTEEVKPTEDVMAKEEVKPTEDTKHEELSIDTPQEQPVNEQVTAPKIETSDDVKRNLHLSFKKQKNNCVMPLLLL